MSTRRNVTYVISKIASIQVLTKLLFNFVAGYIMRRNHHDDDDFVAGD